MATVSMQPWRIYPLCLIFYESEPHNRFITSTHSLLFRNANHILRQTDSVLVNVSHNQLENAANTGLNNLLLLLIHK
ncbi:hypothetical protein HanRHA438_Chr14g0678661 [Helianthus annuus]|nr:hypothetical protein HanHA89_Chr14g0591681 [Helianthus annuus]KAJ0855921.1 hypothetical protein HanRHA438_Chr14g0678661 [Helianthus annuus]